MNADPSQGVTFDQFSFLALDDQKADLIAGVVYYEGPEEPASNVLHTWLTRLLTDFVEEHDLGEVYAFRVAFRLDETNGPEPDLAFVRKDRLDLVDNGFVDGPPDLALEIVSGDSVDRDYKQKRQQYQDARVPEYWIVDELEEKLTLLRLGSNGKYREMKLRKGALHSEVLPGFHLEPEWLWQEPRPRKSDVLARMMAELVTR
jgi:Uma2 family endonuclease